MGLAEVIVYREINSKLMNSKLVENPFESAVN